MSTVNIGGVLYATHGVSYRTNDLYITQLPNSRDFFADGHAHSDKTDTILTDDSEVAMDFVPF